MNRKQFWIAVGIVITSILIFSFSYSHKQFDDNSDIESSSEISYPSPNFTLTSENYIYDGSEKSLSINEELPEGYHVTYTNNEKVDVGEYIVVACFSCDTNEDLIIDDIEATLCIEKATYDMTEVSFSSTTIDYDGNTKSNIITGTLPDGVSVKYTGNDQSNVGTYSVTATFTSDSDNYYAIPEMDSELTISKVSYDMSKLNLKAQTYTYDETAQIGEITDELPEGVTIESYVVDEVTDGVSYATVYFNGDENHNEIPSMKVILKVINRAYDMSSISFTDKTYTYDGELKSLILEGDLPDDVSVTFKNNSRTLVGTSVVTAVFSSDDPDYGPIASIDASLIITKATYDMSGITLVDQSIIYDGTEQQLVITGDLPSTDITVNYDNSGTVVGEYPTVVTFTSSNSNYDDIISLTATLTITKGTFDMSGVYYSNKTVEYTNTVQYNYLTGTVPSGVTVSYSNNSLTDIGTTNCVASFVVSDSNYNKPNSLSATLVIKTSLSYTTVGGTIHITGTNSYSYSKNIVIPSAIGGLPVTAIDDDAFSAKWNIETLYIPDSITSIGNHAFSQNSDLIDLYIPNSVTTISENAFTMLDTNIAFQMSESTLYAQSGIVSESNIFNFHKGTILYGQSR